MGMWPHRKFALAIVSHTVKTYTPLLENRVVEICWKKSTLQENGCNHVCTLIYSTESLQYTLKCSNIVAIKLNILKDTFLMSVSILILYHQLHVTDWKIQLVCLR